MTLIVCDHCGKRAKNDPGTRLSPIGDVPEGWVIGLPEKDDEPLRHLCDTCRNDDQSFSIEIADTLCRLSLSQFVE